MKKIMTAFIALALIALTTGCSSIATKPITQRVPQKALRTDNPQSVIYLSDTQSIPTSLLEQSVALMALVATNGTNDVSARSFNIPAEVLIGLANSAMQLVPQMNEQYIESRRATGTVSREFYAVGFENNPEALEALRALVAEWSTSQNKSIINNYR